MVAGKLAFTIGHKRGLRGPQLPHEVHQVVKGVALDVELAGLGPGGQHLGQLVHIICADMALVRARVHGDALRTGLQAQACSPGNAGNAQMARVAHQGDLVEVDR